MVLALTHPSLSSLAPLHVACVHFSGVSGLPYTTSLARKYDALAFLSPFSVSWPLPTLNAATIHASSRQGDGGWVFLGAEGPVWRPRYSLRARSCAHHCVSDDVDQDVVRKTGGFDLAGSTRQVTRSPLRYQVASESFAHRRSRSMRNAMNLLKPTSQARISMILRTMGLGEELASFLGILPSKFREIILFWMPIQDIFSQFGREARRSRCFSFCRFRENVLFCLFRENVPLRCFVELWAEIVADPQCEALGSASSQEVSRGTMFVVFRGHYPGHRFVAGTLHACY